MGGDRFLLLFSVSLSLSLWFWRRWMVMWCGWSLTEVERLESGGIAATIHHHPHIHVVYIWKHSWFLLRSTGSDQTWPDLTGPDQTTYTIYIDIYIYTEGSAIVQMVMANAMGFINLFPNYGYSGLLILSPPSHKFLFSTTTRNPNRNRNDASNQFYSCGSSFIIIINRGPSPSSMSMLWGHVLDSTPILCRHHPFP